MLNLCCALFIIWRNDGGPLETLHFTHLNGYDSGHSFSFSQFWVQAPVPSTLWNNFWHVLNIYYMIIWNFKKLLSIFTLNCWRSLWDLEQLFQIHFFYVIFFAETSLGYLGTSPGSIGMVSWPQKGAIPGVQSFHLDWSSDFMHFFKSLKGP